MPFKFIPPDLNKLHEYFLKEQAKIMESVKEAYYLACMDAVNMAKSTNTYKDRTNNLRSSVGFVLYYNGNLVHEYFAPSGTGSGGGGNVGFKTKGGSEVSFTAKSGDNSGSAGMGKAKALAHEVAGRHKDGFVAVIVAGMNYALYVEAMGYDVLTGSTLQISLELQKNFDIINKQHGTSFGRQNI